MPGGKGLVDGHRSRQGVVVAVRAAIRRGEHPAQVSSRRRGRGDAGRERLHGEIADEPFDPPATAPSFINLRVTAVLLSWISCHHT